VGFQEGHELGYTDDINEEGFDEGFREMFSDAVSAGRVLGRLRLVSKPDGKLVDETYRKIREDKFEDITGFPA